MRRVIAGRVYDTETAERIGEASTRSGSMTDWSEALYKTQRGAFFVAGSGGAMSHYAESVGQNQWSGGSRLWLLTTDEALEWCERFEVDAAVVGEHFAIEEG